jgi:DNA polymerase-3 subunit delta
VAKPFHDDSPLEIQTLLTEARQGKWKPVHVLCGTEKFLIDRAAGLLKKATVGEGRGFNDDVFHGSAQLSGQKVVAAARTLPMMAAARFVLVRDIDELPAAELDALAQYVASPSPSTCLVLTAEKLDARTKLVKAAKETGAWVAADTVKGPLLERFASAEAKRRGHHIEQAALSALVDAVGSDLAAVEDAIERCSLYVGAESGKPRPIDVNAIESVVERVRVDTIWALVDAIALRRTAPALEAVGSLLEARENELMILGSVARQLRLVARMKDALEAGMGPDEAVKVAGGPPFKARALADAARKFSHGDLGRAFTLLAETDVQLKGSKRDPGTLLEETVLRLCVGS